MVVLISPTQGTEKSSALAVLAVKEDWFVDDFPLGEGSQKVMEQTEGKWIVEAAELKGIRAREAEHLKASLSRRSDRARKAFGHLPSEQRRQFVIFGTTNEQRFLRDPSGNRRFWPVEIERFDLKALRENRDQMWAEASYFEKQGESIRLAQELWAKAAEEQQER